MKKAFFLVLGCCFSASVFGQIDFDKYTTTTSFGDATKQEIGFVVATPEIGMYKIGLNFRHVMLQVRDSTFEAKRPKGSILERVDSSEAHIFVRGINQANAHDYEFRIIDNKDKVFKPWQNINQFADEDVQIRDFPKGMAYLGGYKTPWNQYLVADIRKKNSPKVVATMAMFGQQIKPVLLNIFTNKEVNQLLSTVKQSFPLYLDQNERNVWAAKYAPSELDEYTYLPKKLILEPTEHEVFFLLNATIFPKQALEHKVIKDGKVYLDWQANENNNNFISLENLNYGEYKLLIRYAIQRHNVLEYPFQIKPKWYQTSKFQWILGFSIGLAVLLLITLQQRQKLKKQKLENEIGQELKAIRSQLNPHFVFNALSSIQGLMNKSDLTNANYYLTEFSTLLRESLLRNDKENVPLSIELKTLETYIKLERLRFPFRYSIDIDAQLDVHAIEIPYLLLQPLVENAIKHGVSNMYEKGVLSIHVYPKGNALIVEIKDNGKGFDTTADTQGYGLKLTKERVRLLSASNGQQAVKLVLESDVEKGTIARLIFKNWI
jgi:two-component system, LytTR family, sensor kinase